MYDNISNADINDRLLHLNMKWMMMIIICIMIDRHHHDYFKLINDQVWRLLVEVSAHCKPGKPGQAGVGMWAWYVRSTWDPSLG